MIGDGGDNITRIALLFMMFLLPHRASADSGSVRVWLHNLGVVAIACQVCLLYTTAGFMKARGELWHNGTALYYISQVDVFWHPLVRGLTKTPLIAFAAYATILHQIAFSVALVSRLRIAWVAVGIMFHLGIALFMGLVPFSLVMMGLELSLLCDDDYATMRKASARWRGRCTKAALTLLQRIRGPARASS